MEVERCKEFIIYREYINDTYPAGRRKEKRRLIRKLYYAHTLSQRSIILYDMFF